MLNRVLTGVFLLIFLTGCNLKSTELPPTATVRNGCIPASGWPTYTVQAGDTLTEIAQSVGLTIDELAQGNCLENRNQLARGQYLRVPFLPNAACAEDLLPATQGIDFVVISPSESLSADCLLLEIGATVTVAWPGAPATSAEVTFYRMSSALARPDVIGVDNDGSDGFSIEWAVTGIPPSVIYAIGASDSDVVGVFAQ